MSILIFIFVKKEYFNSIDKIKIKVTYLLFLTKKKKKKKLTYLLFLTKKKKEKEVTYLLVLHWVTSL